MALGPRWGARPVQAMAALRTETAGVPVVPVTVLDPDAVLETRVERIYAQTRNVKTIFGTFPVPVAELPAPPTGHVHRIERLSIMNLPNASSVLVLVGDLDALNAVDAVDVPTASALVTDDPHGIYVPENQPLYIAWMDVGADPAPYLANVQYRVEVL